MTMGGREAAGGKILRCAQNDIGGKAQNDRGEAQNDRGEAQNDKRGILSF